MPSRRNVTKVPKSRICCVRLSAEDSALVEQLRADTGIRSLTDLVRLALRALAKKEGVRPG